MYRMPVVKLTLLGP